MTSEGQSKFLGILHISKCWGPSGGQLTYAGCGRLLKDGRPCGLGLKARRLREISSSTQMSSSQHGTPGGRSRDRGGHTCVEIGEHVQMYHFFVETVKPCHILEPWGITVIGNPSFGGSQRVLSFSCTSNSSSRRGPDSANTPSTRVGVVEVVTAVRSSFETESSVVSGRPSSPSMQVLKRLQSRVVDLGNDIADVIANLKLENEEFAESLTD
ncbi:hypothetical protein R1sor_017819 [Riccia sorocarpa]|uniref:Uncharacterized protein n=1 Tax=Riccia sorocarpa TaxID=122646 RepID=A0ABD3I823_9MARC